MLLRKFKDDLFQHKLKSQSNMMPAKRAAIKFESFFKWYCWIPLNQCPLILIVPFVFEWELLVFFLGKKKKNELMRRNLSKACVRRLLKIVLGVLWLSSLLGKSPGGNSQSFRDAWKESWYKLWEIAQRVWIDSSLCPLTPIVSEWEKVMLHFHIYCSLNQLEAIFLSRLVQPSRHPSS